VRYLDVDTSRKISKIGLGTGQFGSRGMGSDSSEGLRIIVAPVEVPIVA
jgi:hypothetical protein